MEGDMLNDSRLEKYSRLLLKELEVHEKMERATRLAVRYSNLGPGFITPERTRKLQRTYTDGPLMVKEHNKLIKSESLQAMSQTWDETKMKNAMKKFGADNMSSGSTSSLPKELERCTISDVERRAYDKIPKRKAPSAALIQRKREADAKNSLRMERIQSLEKDCEKAQWIIYRIKALSMPSLRSDSPKSIDTSVSDVSLDGLLSRYETDS